MTASADATREIAQGPVTSEAMIKETDGDAENHVDYTSQGGPSLSLLWSREPLVGQSLYLGGEVGCDGKIYCIPGHATRVLVIDPKTDQVYPIGPELPGKFKWLRGVRCKEVIYGLPCHAQTVLRIHVPTNTISQLPMPYSEFYKDDTVAKEQRDMLWKYHGGTTCPIDGCIYAIPQSAWHVLKINPETDTCEFVNSPAMKQKYKFYGGVVGKGDGAIYGIPHNSPSVLRIDPLQDHVVSLHGGYGLGNHKWHGASVARHGTIVSVPANADTVLCIQPKRPEPTLFELGGPDVVKTGRHRSDGKYKYLGAMTGTDGMVYCFPSGSEQVLQVDTTLMQVRNVGPNLYDTQMEKLLQNKWQNGLTSVAEKCTFAIPLAAETVLRIDTSKPDEPNVTTWKLPAPFQGLAKWEGGTLAKNGAMYCMPNNHKAVLKITPSPRQQNKAKGKRSKLENMETRIEPGAENVELDYTTGIATLRSSAHRVKFRPNLRKCDPKPTDRETTWLPPSICAEDVFQYDQTSFDFCSVVAAVLEEKCDPLIVGSFLKGSTRLENFRVPQQSLSRKSYGGQVEDAQSYLSGILASDSAFLDLFDRFVRHAVLPYFKKRLESEGVFASDEPITFYYQRPPTMRIQPGPARASVKAHNDAEYGHQPGELNFWFPLTDRELTKVDLYCESEYMKNDYHPLVTKVGEVVSFHGSSCRHFVNSNRTENTRVSFDFRVGVQGFFDPHWQMEGTTSDHDREQITL